MFFGAGGALSCPDMNACPDHDRLIVLETRFESAERARALQAVEYERRLGDLNHAHDKQVDDQSTYVSLDRYEANVGEATTWRSGVDQKLAVLDGTTTGGKPLRDIGMIVVGALIAYVLNLLTKA